MNSFCNLQLNFYNRIRIKQLGNKENRLLERGNIGLAVVRTDEKKSIFANHFSTISNDPADDGLIV